MMLHGGELVIPPFVQILAQRAQWDFKFKFFSPGLACERSQERTTRTTNVLKETPLNIILFRVPSHNIF